MLANGLACGAGAAFGVSPFAIAFANAIAAAARSCSGVRRASDADEADAREVPLQPAEVAHVARVDNVAAQGG